VHWLDFNKGILTFQYVYRTLQRSFVIRKAAPQPHPLQTRSYEKIMIHSTTAIAHGYSWLCVQETHTIMLEGQNINACSWGLMNSNYIDNDFTYNIYTSLRSNIMLKTNQKKTKSTVIAQCDIEKTEQLNSSVKVIHTDGWSLNWQVLCRVQWGTQILCRRVNQLCKQFKHHLPQFTQKNPTRCNSVWKFIIPYLFWARHVSGDTPPIIRSLKLH
jgi:hypothetical protein